jgi:phospholipase/carboxylesterase
MTPLSFQHVYRPGESPGGATLILLHGTGGDENDLLPIGPDLLPGAALLSPRGQISENGTLRFFKRSSPGVLDIEDWRARSHQLADFITEASLAYHFNPDNTFAVGLSNGANIATGLLLLRHEVLAGGVLLRPMFVAEVSPRPHLKGKSVLIQSGRTDLLQRPGDTERLRDQFSSAGAAVTVRTQAAGHNLVPNDIVQSREWLASTQQS